MATFTKTFNSIVELHTFLSENDHYGNFSASWNDSDITPMQSTEALERAAQGGYWPEGAKHIQPVTLDADQLSAHSLDIPTPQIAVTGYRPLVPAYLSGSPKAMINQTHESKPDRMIKIAVNVGKSWSVSTEATFNRGNAILSVIDALNAMGYAIELWAVWHNEAKGDKVHFDVKIKDSSEFWSPDSIAFALCNEAFQRRLIWRALDTANSPICKNFSQSMGNGRSAKYADYDISYPYMGASRHWDNKESTLKHIITHTQTQLRGKA